MNKYNGGYLIIGKTDEDLQSKLLQALTLGKPVLWYENDNSCYFIDTINATQVSPGVITFTLKKGGLTITVANDGTVTEEGTIEPSGGGSSLYNIKVYGKINGYVTNLVCQVDDANLETYEDLYNYLNDKGYKADFVGTDDVILPAIGINRDISNAIYFGLNVYKEDSNKIINVITVGNDYEIIDDEDFAISYID